MQLSVIADKSTCMCNIQIAFSSIPLISTNKLPLIESSLKISKNSKNNLNVYRELFLHAPHGFSAFFEAQRFFDN